MAKKVGAPSNYSESMASKICALLASGMSLNKICKIEGMPSMQTVFNWLAKYPEFLENYARAREAQADVYADEIIDITDEPAKIVPTTGAVDSADVAQKRLQVDARKWLASKLKPKKYGDKVTNEVIGQDGGPVKIETIKRVIVDPGTKDT